MRTRLKKLEMSRKTSCCVDGGYNSSISMLSGMTHVKCDLMGCVDDFVSEKIIASIFRLSN